MTLAKKKQTDKWNRIESRNRPTQVSSKDSEQRHKGYSLPERKGFFQTMMLELDKCTFKNESQPPTSHYT